MRPRIFISAWSKTRVCGRTIIKVRARLDHVTSVFAAFNSRNWRMDQRLNRTSSASIGVEVYLRTIREYLYLLTEPLSERCKSIPGGSNPVLATSRSSLSEQAIYRFAIHLEWLTFTPNLAALQLTKMTWVLLQGRIDPGSRAAIA